MMTRADPENLLIPRPRRLLEGDLALFLLVALLVHLLAYFWVSKHAAKMFHKAGSLIHVQMVTEITPPPKPKLKPLPPPLKPKISSLKQPKITPPPLLKINPVKFHKAPTNNHSEPSNLQSIEEPKNGSSVGNPKGTPGGTGNIEKPPPTPVLLPPPPKPKPLIPDRKNPGVVSRCIPTYPEMERDQGIEGTVGILVVVGRGGQAVEARVAQSSGNPNLDNAALENVRQCWKFSPAIQNGEPVEARLTFTITFKLQ